MNRAGDQGDLRQETQQLLQGPLKHVKAAALAAALVPLASVAAAPAAAQDSCQSAGTVCGMVWNDTNRNGIQDAGEPGIEGAKVFVSDGTDTFGSDTGPDGFYYFFLPQGTYTIYVQVPTGKEPSPPDAGGDDTLDSDGIPDGFGNSVAENVAVFGEVRDTDFGFSTKPLTQPGTGTPGYWKNHPNAWPVADITVGGVTYTKAEAIAWMQRVGKDKTTTMFASLVSAMLNVGINNDASCVSSTIAAANDWMAAYGPVGSGVAAKSTAWVEGEWMHQQMDDYNNGRLCAPHRK